MTNKNKERGKYPTLNIAVVYMREVVKSNTPPRQANTHSEVVIWNYQKKGNSGEMLRWASCWNVGLEPELKPQNKPSKPVSALCMNITLILRFWHGKNTGPEYVEKTCRIVVDVKNSLYTVARIKRYRLETFQVNWDVRIKAVIRDVVCWCNL